jgi:hypothetical protein
MPTSVNVNDPSRHDSNRIRALAESRGKGIGQPLSKLSERVAIGLLIAAGLVFLVVGTIYLSSLAGLVEPKDVGQSFVGP